MVARIIFFLSGFGLSVVGFVFSINYLNSITIGYSLKEYVHFISSSIECLIGPLGLLITSLAIFLPGGKKNELHI